jgi:hypothetical protein
MTQSSKIKYINIKYFNNIPEEILQTRENSANRLDYLVNRDQKAQELKNVNLAYLIKLTCIQIRWLN